ncbi:MAG: LacI family DNA-binding transcriptional regulator [Ndongobacter sp.]|nr:LacI family DNA-binding transcriptional regulator [Ndongobacter sp.]
MRVTIKDVAKKAGYSTATVSLILNRKCSHFSKRAIYRVNQAAKELGYRPNRLAISMVTKQTHVIGLIIPDNSNMFFAELSKAIEMSARKFGYSVVYGNSSNEPLRDMEYIQMFEDRQVDGVIFTKSFSANEENDLETAELIQCSKLPFVLVDRELSGNHISSVLLNHRRGGYLATKHLLEQGHRRIGCITGPHTVTSSKQRLQGYRDALEEFGVAYCESYIFEGDFQMNSGRIGMNELLHQSVTAVFSFNDMMAYGVYQAIAEQGLRIPEDVSVVGFDDLWVSSTLHPALTTVHQPVEEIGAKTVEVLLTEMEGNIIERSCIFEPTLVIRNSVMAR